MDYPDFPVPVGVFRDIEAPIFEDLIAAQVNSAREKSPPDFQALLHGSETWEVS
jgi:2-oxoglutarate ferredoxin oxidoreductase subunit beta